MTIISTRIPSDGLRIQPQTTTQATITACRRSETNQKSRLTSIVRKRRRRPYDIMTSSTRWLAVVVLAFAIILESFWVSGFEQRQRDDNQHGLQQQRIICQVLLTDFVRGEDRTNQLNKKVQDDRLDCVVIKTITTTTTSTAQQLDLFSNNIDTSHNNHLNTYTNKDPLFQEQETIQLQFETSNDDASQDSFLTTHWKDIRQETLFLQVSARWIDRTENTLLYQPHQVRVLPREEWEQLVPHGLDDDHDDRRRRLATIGAKKVGVVRVQTQHDTNLLTVPVLEQILYQTASQQLRDCSGGQAWLHKQDATLTVTLPGSISDYNKITVANAARVAVCQHYNLPDHCQPALERGLDHVLYSVPRGLVKQAYDDDTTNKEERWAYASTGDARRFSVYSQDYFIPSTILHELGHNYRLGHAKQDGETYGDSTGHMGGGVSQKRCFNGYNLWVLGWFGHQTTEITTLVPGKASLYTLQGLANAQEQPKSNVNLKIGRYYLTFNLAQGSMAETEEYQDQVLIHSGLDSSGSFGDTLSMVYSHTSLEQSLARVGESFRVSNFDAHNNTLWLQLCAIDKYNSDGAVISVGLNVGCIALGNSRSDQTDPPILQSQTPSLSPSPTIQQNQPSSSPSAVASSLPTVNPELISGEARSVTATQDSMTEFHVNVPAHSSSIECRIHGGTGEADLLTKWFSPPKKYSAKNDCFPYLWGNDETCFFDTESIAQDQPLYVSIHAYRGIANVELVCLLDGGSERPSSSPTAPTAQPSSLPTLSPAPSSIPTETPSVEPSLSPSRKPSQEPSIVQPTLFPSLVEDKKLVVSSRPSLLPSGQPSLLPSLRPSLRPSAYPTVLPSLEPTSESPTRDCTALQNGHEVLDLTGEQGQSLSYCLDLPPNATEVTCRIREGFGDADLILNFGSKPDVGGFDNACYPYKWGTTEYCFQIPIPVTDSILHVYVHGFDRFVDVNLLCYYQQPAGGDGLEGLDVLH